MEWRWGGGSTERFPEFAADVVQRNVDIIVAPSDAAGLAAQRETKHIPIVLFSGDPIGAGLVDSLSHPGGNITGVSSQSTDLAAKRLQILKEMIPSASRVALLADANDLPARHSVEEAQSAARTVGVRLKVHQVGHPGELPTAFSTIAKQRAGAVLIVGGTMFYANRVELAKLALKNRLPMMCGTREFADAGCLISYGANLSERFRRLAYFVDRILKGTKPSELPVEQPTRFEMVVNLKTAKALGIDIPRPAFDRIDEVIR